MRKNHLIKIPLFIGFPEPIMLWVLVYMNKKYYSFCRVGLAPPLILKAFSRSHALRGNAEDSPPLII
ncbi:hypothetical protein GMMP13_20033 [Candidatus Magnetomoraceae bacterium gMMP-13]